MYQTCDMHVRTLSIQILLHQCQNLPCKSSKTHSKTFFLRFVKTFNVGERKILLNLRFNFFVVVSWNFSLLISCKWTKNKFPWIYVQSTEILTIYWSLTPFSSATILVQNVWHMDSLYNKNITPNGENRERQWKWFCVYK